MKNSIKVVLTAAFLCAGSFAGAMNTAEKADAVSAQAGKEILLAQKAQALDVYTLKTTWQRCELYVSRSRGNGKRVRVPKPWTCEEVTTSCGAVVAQGRAFASASCFYVPAEKDQKVSLKKAVLVSSGNQSVMLKRFLGKVKDLVAFALN